jgi:deoxyribodipyrimidine photo-lyase
MWFASIWIFTLKLPWVLGADFFLRHLLDGDPASNTLSWRWVAGLHTRGKTYLATERNIRRYAAERFDLDAAEAGLERLSSAATALEAPANPPPSPIAWPASPEPSARSGVLLTEEDLLIDFPVDPRAVTALRAETGVCNLVHQFKMGALEDALARAGARLPGAEVSEQAASVDEVTAWARQHELEQVWFAYAPVGYVRSRLESLEQALAEAGTTLVPFVREYDRLVWPHCSKGFFQLRKLIPELLDALAVGETEPRLLMAGED